MLHTLKWPGLAITLIWLTACGASIPEQPLQYTADSNDVAETTKNSDLEQVASNQAIQRHARCHAYVRNIFDKRHNKTRFSEYAEYQKFAETVPEWVKSGFNSLQQKGFDMQPPRQPDEEVLALDIYVYKAYVKHIRTSKAANLALKVVFARQGQTVYENIYRGNDSSINWNSSVDEMQEAMNAALSQVLEFVEADLTHHCQSS